MSEKESPLDVENTSKVAATIAPGSPEKKQIVISQPAHKTGLAVLEIPLIIEQIAREKPEIMKLLEKTAIVLCSETSHAEALHSNIESFHEAVNDKRDKLSLLDMMTSHDRQLKELKASVARIQNEKKRKDRRVIIKLTPDQYRRSTDRKVIYPFWMEAG